MTQGKHRQQSQTDTGSGQMGSDSGQAPMDVTPTGQVGRDFAPDEVELYLGGTKYPASRSHLMERAVGNGAPREITGALESLPDKSYRSPADVIAAVSRLA